MRAKVSISVPPTWHNPSYPKRRPGLRCRKRLSFTPPKAGPRASSANRSESLLGHGSAQRLARSVDPHASLLLEAGTASHGAQNHQLALALDFETIARINRNFLANGLGDHNTPRPVQ